MEQARLIAAELGYPLVVRPSYVLGGRAMQIIREEGQLGDYLLGRCPSLCRLTSRRAIPTTRPARSIPFSVRNPLLFDPLLSDAIEVDVDCLADGKTSFVAGIHGAHRGGRHPFRR